MAIFDEICEWHRKLRSVLLADPKFFDLHKEYLLSTSAKDLTKRIKNAVL